MTAEKQSHRVLLVDDELDFLKGCKVALTRRGLEIETASDGAAALVLLEQQRFDAAVLDVKMPGIDGVELFQRIYSRWPYLPVIMLTGHGSLAQAFQTSRDGVFDYLSKPVDMDYLAQVIRRAVSETSSASQGVERRQERAEGEAPPVAVLLVDDEEDLRRALSRVLQRRGMEVDTAATGAEGLELAAQRAYDVVVLDVRLPDIDGLEVLKSMKQRSPLTEVILLTGHPTISTAIRGMQLGAHEFFVKPHDPESLCRTIREAYWKRRARSEEEARRFVDAAVSKCPS